MSEPIKGTEDFVAASDEFYGYLAKIIREEIAKETRDLTKLKELSDLVKTNSTSIKTQKEETKGGKTSPAEKLKNRANGVQVSV